MDSTHIYLVLWQGLDAAFCPAGAALYAQDPSTVYARRSRFAYGVHCTTKWHHGLPRHLMFVEPTTGERLCQNMFASLVAYYELVEHDKVGSGSRMTVAQLSTHWTASLAAGTYDKTTPEDVHAIFYTVIHSFEVRKQVNAFDINLLSPCRWWSTPSIPYENVRLPWQLHYMPARTTVSSMSLMPQCAKLGSCI